MPARLTGRWGVVAALLAALLIVPLADGLLRAGASGSAAVEVAPTAGSILVVVDGGPDPAATPALARALRERGVPAAFRLRGRDAVRHPRLVRALSSAGFAISSGPPTRIAGWRRRVDRAAGTAAIVRATGRRPAIDPLSAAGLPPVLVLAGSPPHGAITGELERLDAAISRGARPLMPPAAQPASTQARASAAVVAATLGAGAWLNGVVPIVLLAVSALLLARVLLVLPAALVHARRLARADPHPEFRPPVTVVVPAFNEEVGIERAVRSFFASGYPDLTVIVVDDGSTDGTAGAVECLCDELPGLRLIRKRNGGKSTALNRGIVAARTEIVVTVDGDTVFEPGTLAAMVAPFADQTVGGVSGNVKVGNRRGLLGALQHVEYVMTLNTDRRLYDLFGCMPTVPGAAGAYRKAALLAVGGVSTATLAEDTDISIAIQRAGWRIHFAPHARAWTEAPSTWKVLWSQRVRWNYGTIQAVFKHRGTITHPGRHDRRLGRIGLPYLLCFHLTLPFVLPIADLFALIGLLLADPLVSLAWFGGSTAAMLILVGIALRMDGEPLRALWAVPFEALGFRQVKYLTILTALISAVLGSRLRWHKLRRTGDVAVDCELTAERHFVTL